ncbi:OmpW family outer membrane protein [Oceanisphaera pacifica]|uniref:Outer membrane beta-barrel protein n=1 Tax=Oceanisphaera pacifica TaxID=2818389 RepID=A0ABS3NIR5_9GAMM|nr:OmpW family outer membrane protein [Oceanisphaera pacifica]MBO1520420.1 outer membrane beta-barrel protein [Oceanisphaera pacifica]
MKKVALLVAAALMAPSAFAHQAGDILVRGGAVTVTPNSSGDDVLGTGHLDVQSNTQLGLTFSYMLTDNWGVELLGATPFSHSVRTAGLGEVAKVKHLPPSLVAQYYFGNAQSKVRPYVGAGINYTFFFDEKGRGPLAGTDVEADDSWGLAAQAGIDMAVTDKLFVNGSIWYMDIDTEVTTAVGNFDTSIDPIGLMVGLGYRF